MADGFQFSTLDMLSVNPAFSITQGVSYNAPYLYVTPHNYYLIAKIDPKTFTIIDTLDLSKVDTNLVGFLSSFATGGYLYLAPHYTAVGPVYQSEVVMVDLANFTPGGCKTVSIFDAGPNMFGIGSFTDGVYGYVNTLTTNPNRMTVTRFGLGAKFNAASVSQVTITDVGGLPFRSGTADMLCDADNIYMLTQVQVAVGKPNLYDYYCITIPTNNFTAKAATFQRVTNANYPGMSVPTDLSPFDDGKNIWCFPAPITNGPLAGTQQGVLKIPKAKQSAAQIFPSLTAKASPAVVGFGTAIYDGWRFGYVASSVGPQILQLDTTKPGAVVSLNTGSALPFYGMVADKNWAYATSFNGAAGLCLRFHPLARPTTGTG